MTPFGICQVSAGSRHTLALSGTNEVWAFGNGENGQLASGDAVSQPRPRRVQGLPAMAVACVAATGDHSFAIVQQSQNGHIGLPGSYETVEWARVCNA